jgi:hypothetical protein
VLISEWNLFKNPHWLHRYYNFNNITNFRYVKSHKREREDSTTGEVTTPAVANV